MPVRLWGLSPQSHHLTAAAASARDPRVVRGAALLRDPALRERERAVLLDGPALVRTALEEGAELRWVLGDPGELALPAGVPVAPARGDALVALAALGQPPAVVAECALPAPPDPADAPPPRSLVLAGVHDAGNVGGILRTAAAFGLPRVAPADGAGDPWSRRALRAAQAVSLRPGLVGARTTLAALAAAPGRPALAAAVPRGGEHPDDLPAGVAIVLGGEAAGLDADALALCDLAVTVPAPGFESLNVAAAAAILAWHLA